MFRLKYILTWVAFIVAVLDSVILLAMTWNSRYMEAATPVTMILLWIILIASLSYLFWFAVKLTFSDFQNVKQDVKHDIETSKSTIADPKKSDPVPEILNIEATVRKILRGVSEELENEEKGSIILGNMAKELEIMSGLVYFRDSQGLFRAEARYAIRKSDEPYSFREGEGLTGQVVKNRHVTVFSNIPADYMEVSSGLGSGKPGYLAIVPVMKGKQTYMVIECSGFKYSISVLERIFNMISRQLSTDID